MRQLSFVEAIRKGIANHPYIEHGRGKYFTFIADDDPHIEACAIGFALIGVGVNPLEMETVDFRELALKIFPELKEFRDLNTLGYPYLSPRIDMVIRWNDRFFDDIQTIISRYEYLFSKKARQEGARRKDTAKTARNRQNSIARHNRATTLAESAECAV